MKMLLLRSGLPAWQAVEARLQTCPEHLRLQTLAGVETYAREKRRPWDLRLLAAICDWRLRHQL